MITLLLVIMTTLKALEQFTQLHTKTCSTMETFFFFFLLWKTPTVRQTRFPHVTVSLRCFPFHDYNSTAIRQDNGAVLICSHARWVKVHFRVSFPGSWIALKKKINKKNPQLLSQSRKSDSQRDGELLRSHSHPPSGSDNLKDRRPIKSLNDTNLWKTAAARCFCSFSPFLLPAQLFKQMSLFCWTFPALPAQTKGTNKNPSDTFTHRLKMMDT